VISDFYLSATEAVLLLGCYAAYMSVFVNWHFGTASWSHLQRSCSPRITAWPLKMGPIGCPKKMANN